VRLVRRAIDTREVGAHALQRVRAAWEPVALASVAAALAWLIAHRVLGHSQPFFAPIAAAISLSTSRIQRSRRIVQMVGGVLLGIAIGELLATTIGTSASALALIVFATMAAAVLGGAGFVGEGMMFANQAAASAILVTTLHHHGTGSERAIDAIVGGAVALILGVGLFPAEPLAMLGDAERAVLATLASTLERFALRAGAEPTDESWILGAGGEIHATVAALARARSTARTNTRVAPRRWRLRQVVDAENRRTLQLHLLSSAVLGLIRAAAVGPRPLPGALEQQIASLADALDLLAKNKQPWPALVRDRVLAVSEQLKGYAESQPGSTAPAILGAIATDLVRLTAVPDWVSTANEPQS
jgi:uncharacterized membrane protein YgaE (UPF0421/DUF939 family)